MDFVAIDALARWAAMSSRNFARRFTQVLDRLSPLQPLRSSVPVQQPSKPILWFHGQTWAHIGSRHLAVEEPPEFGYELHRRRQVLSVEQPRAGAVTEDTADFACLYKISEFPCADSQVPGGLSSLQESWRELAIATHAPLVLRKGKFE